MIIKVGSKNKIKVIAAQEIILDYSHLRNADIISVDVPTEVSDQPKSLEETIEGAMNRAKKLSGKSLRKKDHFLCREGLFGQFLKGHLRSVIIVLA